MTLDSSRINWGKLLSRIVLYFVVSLICIFILYPYFVMLCTLVLFLILGEMLSIFCH